MSDKDYSFSVYITGNVDIDTFGKIPERKYIQEIQYDLHGAYINNTTNMALIFVTSVSGEINGARTVEPGGKDGIFINTSCKVCSILITVRSINSEYLKIIYINVP